MKESRSFWNPEINEMMNLLDVEDRRDDCSALTDKLVEAFCEGFKEVYVTTDKPMPDQDTEEARHASLNIYRFTAFAYKPRSRELYLRMDRAEGFAYQSDPVSAFDALRGTLSHNKSTGETDDFETFVINSISAYNLHSSYRRSVCFYVTIPDHVKISELVKDLNITKYNKNKQVKFDGKKVSSMKGVRGDFSREHLHDHQILAVETTIEAAFYNRHTLDYVYSHIREMEKDEDREIEVAMTKKARLAAMKAMVETRYYQKNGPTPVEEPKNKSDEEN